MISDANRIVKFYFSPENRVRLSPSALTVLLAMAVEVQGQINLSQVSYKRVQELTGIGSKNTVARALRELKLKGFISPIFTHAGQYRPQLYLLMPKKEETRETRSPLSLKPYQDLNDLFKELDESS